MSLRSAFFGFYRMAQSIIAPSLRYSQATYESVLDAQVAPGNDWMDLGCGHQLLPPWRFEQERQLAARAGRLVGFDYDFDALRKHRTIVDRVRGDVSRLPFPEGTFDFVSSNMVFEHLREPEIQLAEIYRVLRPGGALIFHTPNKYGYGVLLARLLPGWIKIKLAWLLQGREAEDVYPAFYRINSTSAIRTLAEGIGFRVREIKLIVSSPSLIMIPPLVIFELLLLRALMTRPFQALRTNIIAVLEKPAD